MENKRINKWIFKTSKNVKVPIIKFSNSNINVD